MGNELLRKLPKVDELLRNEKVIFLCKDIPRELVTNSIREVISDVRANILNGITNDINIDEIISLIEKKVCKKSEVSLKKVINATGTILHTNFGRAVISEKAAKEILDVAFNYSNLEYDLKAGGRGDRQKHIEKIITEVTGAEAAMVVNNNAAATMIVLAALSSKKETIISRGELIEIGGSFRIPDVMNWSNAILKEVGTTNKTHLYDYENAFDKDKTAAIMKVHTSNYKIVGFTDDVPVKDLVNLSKKYDVPMIYDMGNGLMVDLTEYGVDEPNVISLIKEGADVVLFSGDKLLGGPQAGIIVGKEKYISKMKKHPLARVFRVDKYTIAALSRVLFEYYDLKEAKKNVPVLRMITITNEELKNNATKLLMMIKENCKNNNYIFDIEKTKDQIGGGTTPDLYIDGYAVSILAKDGKIEKLERNLREINTPIIGHISNDKLYLNIRTIFDYDYSVVAMVFKNI